MTRVIASVIWYDEHPDDIRRFVASMEGFLNGVVAMDGAFATFPRAEGMRPWSPSEQAVAWAEACAEHGIELLVFQPTEKGSWPGFRGNANEVEKRTACLRLCGALKADWVISIDPDMILHESSDPQQARVQLEDTRRRAAVVDVDGEDYQILWRWTATLEHCKTHYYVRDGNRTMWFAGGGEARVRAGVARPERAINLTSLLKFDHLDKTDGWRRVRQNTWYLIRDEQGLETI